MVLKLSSSILMYNGNSCEYMLCSCVAYTAIAEAIGSENVVTVVLK